jgi:Ca2+:H+ antiporter
MLAIQSTIDRWQISQEFIGIIMLPIIGNAAEHYTAITAALGNKMELSIGVAVGSSCQMALLVTPVTVLFGWYYGSEMTLDFHVFQFVVMLLSLILVGGIASKGRSNWLDGLVLLVSYVVLSILYFCEGSGQDTSLANLY